MKILDYPALALVILASLGGIFYGFSGKTGSEVEIQTPTGRYRYPLGQNRTVTIPGQLGPYQVEILSNRVRALSANCPERICLHRGFISHGGDSIVCLPNRIIIRVTATEGATDAVTE